MVSPDLDLNGTEVECTEQVGINMAKECSEDWVFNIIIKYTLDLLHSILDSRYEYTAILR